MTSEQNKPEKNKNNYGFYTIFGIFIAVLLIDLYSTLINGELVQYLESNPLFGFFGLPGIMIFNIVMMALYYYVYTHTKNPNVRFVIIFTFVAVTITRILIIKNNFAMHTQFTEATPEVKAAIVEAAKQVTQSQKMEYVKEYAMLNILPLFNSLFTWLFFAFDHKVEIK